MKSKNSECNSRLHADALKRLCRNSGSPMNDGFVIIAMRMMMVIWRKDYLPLRPFVLDFDGTVEAIFDVCISSPMYLFGHCQ
jgi:hypothetical protein